MKRQQGFTVTELMITVVILGVLATLAIPSFTGYIYKARVTEATTFLGEIKQRQESYRDEFGRYADVSSSLTDFNPSTIPGIDPVAWETTAEWTQLGAAPDGPTRFSYATIAGRPGIDAPPASSNMDGDDHWFVARARGDLDEDNTTFDLEIYSQANHIYNSASGQGGWE
ncbi:MAG: prepilin-type N-terminal cleavage/methylation domain-containing protein [Myxococcota bacterium]